MAKHNSLNELFTATANAIRSKTGSTNPIVADDFPSAIENIEAGGGGGGVVNICESTNPTKDIVSDFSQVGAISFPNAESIGTNAFINCTSLTSIDLPVATSIGNNAFNNCTALTAVILRTTETVCVAEFSAFENTPIMTGQGHVYVPAAMYEYYRAGYEPALEQAGMAGFFDILFHKIEDYPEICGTT